jgi:hypothetical protein
VIAALKEIKFDKFVVLEDFHYLPNDIQKDFSFALKVFHENSKICFIIVGVWREKNRLIYFNGDLTNRVTSIDVDTWSNESLTQVLHAGEKVLNIKFDDTTAKNLVSASSNAVSLLQEGCYKICELENISEKQAIKICIGQNADVQELMKTIVNDQAARYHAFINNFSEGFQQTEYDMYRWLMYVVLSVDQSELEVGVRRNTFSTLIKKKHPVGKQLNEGNITQALQSTASLQVAKGIRPLIIDYDQTSRILNIVDRSFLLWLAFQDRNELLTDLSI